MSDIGAITGYMDVAQMVLYAFWIFFAGLIIYLRIEDKREGYPLASDRKNVKVVGWPAPPAEKTYMMPHGGGTRVTPRDTDGEREVAAEPIAPFPGAPLEPTGNPLVDGVGPAAWSVKRPETPDLTYHGDPKVVPMRVATDFSVSEKDPDPRGMPVVGADGEQAGTVTELWVDRAEPQIRYLEVDASGRRVMVPVNYARISRRLGQVKVVSVLAEHFADAPGTASADQVTLAEEDRICAYYAGGQLYALPQRAEPWL